MAESLRTRVTTALAELAAELLEAGVRSSPDPDQVPIPGAWLHPRTFDPTRLGGEGEVRVDVWLVIGQTATAWENLLRLTDLLDLTLSVPGLALAEPADLDIQLALGQSTHPAVRLAVDLDV